MRAQCGAVQSVLFDSVAVATALLVAAAAAILLAGPAMVRVADRLADVTGLGEALVGAVFVGAATSLPDISATVTPALRGVPDLAVGSRWVESVSGVYTTDGGEEKDLLALLLPIYTILVGQIGWILCVMIAGSELAGPFELFERRWENVFYPLLEPEGRVWVLGPAAVLTMTQILFLLPAVQPDQAQAAILRTRDTFEALADTVVPGARRFAGDRVVLGAASGPGAVHAGAWQMYNDPDVGLAPLLPALGAVLDVEASRYAAAHGGLLSHGVPSFVNLDFTGRTGVVRKLVEYYVRQHNEVMPQKSTYFYPKLPSGLLFHPL